MFKSLEGLFGYDIQATDGEIGKVHDLYFDDKEWITRYLVVDTGPWIFGKKVLLVPSSIGQPNWAEKSIPVNLTRQQVKDSPDISTSLPISEQHQIALHKYYHWSPYWAPSSPLSTSTISTAVATLNTKTKVQEEDKEILDQMLQKDFSLRSAKEVIGYTANGQDGEFGQVDDIILDDDTWQLVYFVLDTSAKLRKGKKTLMAIPWISEISYRDQEVQFELKQNIIENSPPYNPETPINRSFEEVLYDYHGRPFVWAKKSTTTEQVDLGMLQVTRDDEK